MKYQDGILSLLRVDDVAMVQPLADQEELLVIVFNIAEHMIGLLAIGPIDAIEISSEIDGVTLHQTGIMGSTIVDKHTTLLINIFEMAQTLFPQWFEGREVYKARNGAGETPLVLIAEDSHFFRNQVKNYMTEAGYQVLEGEDGQEAWQLLQDNRERVALVVTDIEMPNMNGYELTQKIKGDPRFTGLPVVALTTLAGEEDIAKGKAVGVDEYHIKLDKERLMASVHHFIKQTR